MTLLQFITLCQFPHKLTFTIHLVVNPDVPLPSLGRPSSLLAHFIFRYALTFLRVYADKKSKKQNSEKSHWRLPNMTKLSDSIGLFDAKNLSYLVKHAYKTNFYRMCNLIESKCKIHHSLMLVVNVTNKEGIP